MCLQLLFERIVGFTPETKFVLLRALHVYGTLMFPRKRSTELAQELGLGIKVVSKVLDQLVELGYLEKVKIGVQMGRGRSSIGFLALEPLIRLDKDVLTKNRVLLHEQLISELIEFDNSEASLTNANKLFLSVLLAHADQSGTVRNIGTADLMALTGMSRDRVGYQLDSLKRQGYIRSSVSGVTIPSLFGAATGYIFLNLLHSNYKATPRGGGLVLLLAELKFGANHFQEAKWICEVARACCRFDRITDANALELEWLAESFRYSDELESVLKFFNKITSSHEEKYLQVRLNDYASYLLSNFWGELENLTWDSEVIIDRLQSHVSRMSLDFRKDIDASTDKLKSLAQFLFSVSLRIAKEIKRLLISAGIYPYEDLACAILPYSISRPSSAPGYAIDLCIQVFSKEIDGNLGYVKLGGRRFEKLDPVETGVEDDISFGTRCMAGLISKNYLQ